MHEIEIYKSGNAEIEIRVQFDKDTVWLTQKQMANLFNRDRVAITQHIGNIFKEKELIQESVCKEFLHTANDGKKYKTLYYNLDVIISVGYRVKSQQGTQFRQWATQRLKDYLLKGVTVNQQRLEQLNKIVTVIQQSGSTGNLQINEAKGLLDILSNYARSFILLNQYDSNNLKTDSLNSNITYEIKFDEAKSAITELKKQLIAKREATELFGNEKDDSFAGSFQNVVQTFDGLYLYPSMMNKQHICFIL